MFLTSYPGDSIHAAMMSFHDEFVPEFRSLPEQVQDEVYAVGRLLNSSGRSWVGLRWTR